MTLFFLWFGHYSKVGQRLVINSKKPPDTLTLAVDLSHSNVESHLGCPKMIAMEEQFQNDPLYRDRWQGETPIRRLISYVIETMNLSQTDIVLYIEGNYSESQGQRLTARALDYVNFIKPGTLIFFTSTMECRRFIRYWLSEKGYPSPDLFTEDYWIDNDDKNFDCYQMDNNLISQYINSLVLNYFPLPRIAVLDKDLKRITEPEFHKSVALLHSVGPLLNKLELLSPSNQNASPAMGVRSKPTSSSEKPAETMILFRSNSIFVADSHNSNDPYLPSPDLKPDNEEEIVPNRCFCC